MNPTAAEQSPQTEGPQSAPGVVNGAPVQAWSLEDIPWPNIDEIAIDDGKPVDNMFVEKQARLLTEPLYSSWLPPNREPFVVMADVGLFYREGGPPLVPDVMLATRIRQETLTLKKNRTYFVWVRGKPPDVAIEIVSDRRGDEDAYKLHEYEDIGIPYYVIFDPEEHLKAGVLRAFERRGSVYHPIEPHWLPSVELGLILWTGKFEDAEMTWLRWCGRDGQVIPTGAERAEAERQRNESLLALLREHGIEPPS